MHAYLGLSSNNIIIGSDTLSAANGITSVQSNIIIGNNFTGGLSSLNSIIMGNNINSTIDGNTNIIIVFNLPLPSPLYRYYSLYSVAQ